MSIKDRSVLTDSGIALESMYRSAFLPLQQDCYRNNYNWQAKVVSPPLPASSRDLYALENANSNLENGIIETTPKFTFRAYILNQGSPQKCQSPHAFFEDPCTINDAEDPVCVRQIIERCILITSPEGYGGGVPQVGDTVNIILRQADQHGAYDLQFGSLASLADSSIKNATNFATRAQCQTLGEMFGTGNLSALGGTALGTNQATHYIEAERTADDITLIVLHHTSGSSGAGRAQRTIGRFADPAGPTNAFTWIDPATGQQIQNPTCTQVMAAGAGLPLDTICHPERRQVEKVVRTSIHYAVDQGGGVAQGVLDKDIAHHAGPTWNRRSIGIEMNGDADIGPGEGVGGKYSAMYNEPLIHAVSRLVARLTFEHDIPVDREHIKGHYEVNKKIRTGPGNNAGATLPGQGHPDKIVPPGAYWDWDDFIARVKSIRALPIL